MDAPVSIRSIRFLLSASACLVPGTGVEEEAARADNADTMKLGRWERPGLRPAYLDWPTARRRVGGDRVSG